MPVTIENDPCGGLRITGHGLISGAELVDMNNTIYASDEAVRNIQYQLCDFSRTTGFEVSTLQARQLAAQDNRASLINPNLCIAIVASADLVFGVSRMWGAWVEDSVSNRVFRDYDEAVSWLEHESRAGQSLQDFKSPRVLD